MGEECVGVALRIAIKKSVCIDDDATDTCCWQTECLVRFLFLPAAGMVWAEPLLLLSRSPFVKWLAACGEEVDGWEPFSSCNVKCSLRMLLPEGWWKPGKLLFVSSSSWCASYWGEVKKEKEAAAGRCWCLPFFGLSPAAGSCFCGWGVCGGRIVLRIAAHKSAEAAGRWNTKTLPYKIFKESCEFSFLLISSPDLYFSSFAEVPESNQRYPQSPFKYFALFT